MCRKKVKMRLVGNEKWKLDVLSPTKTILPPQKELYLGRKFVRKMKSQLNAFLPWAYSVIHEGSLYPLPLHQPPITILRATLLSRYVHSTKSQHHWGAQDFNLELLELVKRPQRFLWSVVFLSKVLSDITSNQLIVRIAVTITAAAMCVCCCKEQHRHTEAGLASAIAAGVSALHLQEEIAAPAISGSASCTINKSSW